MKKKFFALMLVALLSVGLITGCGKKKEEEKKVKKEEDLVELYVRAYNEEKPELLLEVFPDFFAEDLKKYVTVEGIKDQKAEYGDDAIYSMKITGKTKMTDDWIEQNNIYLKEYNAQVTECYAIEGIASIKGSLKEDSSEIEEMWYCNFGNDDWRLIGG